MLSLDHYLFTTTQSFNTFKRKEFADHKVILLKWWYLSLKWYKNLVGERRKYKVINPFPDVQILGSSNSAADKDMMSIYGQMGMHCLIE